MADRSSIYSKRERTAAIRALGDRVLYGHSSAKLGEVVDVVAAAFGLKIEGSVRVQHRYEPMDTAPRDRDIVLRTPKGQELRAVWWSNWADPADPKPWAWRLSRPDSTVGEPIEEADGWRELDR